MTLRLPTVMVKKPWGRTTLPAPFADPAGARIGEIWFDPPAALPGLLVKYIFTSEKLSVQVHPSDAQTLAAGIGRQGKEECWLVIDAEPDARLAIGFHEPVDAATMRAAALDGTIEDMLVWHPVQRGDFFYIPANTVHAIGAGVSLIEVQQNSDITYRLFDYGRPRELHLEEGVGVAQGTRYDAARFARRALGSAAATLVDGPLFRLDELHGGLPDDTAARYAGPLLVIPVSGTAEVEGRGIAPGECALAPAPAALRVPEGCVCLIAQPA